MREMRITFLTPLLLVALHAHVLALGAPPRAQQNSVSAGQSAPDVERDDQRRVRVRLARGGRVSLDNGTRGRIVAVGWDRDYVEAVATSARGVEYVRARSEVGPSGQRVTLKADYLTQSWPSAQQQPAATPTPQQEPTPEPSPGPSSPTTAGGAGEERKLPRVTWEPGQLSLVYNVPSEVHLEVRLPRYAEIEPVSVNRSEVEITGIETAVAVSGKRSAIKLKDVGAVQVRNERGPVEVDGASGLVDVVTTGGAITIRNVQGDVRALSLSGRVDVRCVRGRVNVGNTEGAIFLSAVEGDVDATTVNSEVSFDGPVRAEGRYHLKSMLGPVEMAVRRSPPGFTAALSSYRGTVETDFKLNTKRQPNGTSGTRLLGSHGDGRAQITLDSFDGRVKLSRPQDARQDSCK